MPIVDACFVVPSGETAPPGAAKKIADTVAAVVGAMPGRVWVRVQVLSQDLYAENGEVGSVCPLFLTLLHADVPDAKSLAQEAAELANAVGAQLGLPSSLVHIEYAAAGRGRIAFGGNLLT